MRKENTLTRIYIVVSILFSVIITSGFSSVTYEVSKTITPDSLQKMINPPINATGTTWLGADASTSIEIDPDHYIWLFGDTLLGTSRDGKRDYSIFIHNTIGVAQREESGSFSAIKKYYRKNNSKIKAIFNSGKEKAFYWPLVGTMLDSSLLIAADRITTKNTNSFKTLGAELFTVQNPLKSPDGWQYKRHYIPEENGVVWSSALTRRGNVVYLFGQRGTGFDAKTVLSRISVANAESGKWEKRTVFSNEGWQKSATPTTIKGLPGVSETTVQHNPFFNWYSLQIPPLSDDIHLYTAEQITGPWTDQGVVYSIPAPWSNTKTKDGKPVFIAYAVKSHPELAEKEHEIVLTYNVNLDPFVKGLTDKLGEYLKNKAYEGLYVPQFVRIEFLKK